VGVWQQITPSVVTTGAAETCIGQGLAIDRQNPNIIYWGNTPFTVENGGLFKTTDGGSTWTRVASVTPVWAGASDHLDEPLHIRIDPNDSSHLYAGDGVRGSSQGFFVSHDAGATFVKSTGFVDARIAAGIDNEDIYDVAVDPTDFSHVLISFHYRWGWTDTKWNTNSGVMESKDGAATWTIHDPMSGWGSGHSVKFLYNPALGIGDSQTWLLGTQGGGYWRTSDAGASWTKVSAVNITHGGGDVYYAKSGVLYASGEQTIRSTDNGVTWTSVGPGSSWTVHGDGTTLFSGGGWGSNQPFKVSPETDGTTWTNYNAQTVADGPYEMAYDATNGIMYSSSWFSGVWALKLREGTGEIPDAGGGSGGSGGSDGAGAGGAGGTKAGAGGSAGSAGSIGAGGASSSGGRSGVGGAARTDAGAAGAKPATGQAASAAGGAGEQDEAGEDAAPATDAGCACRASRSSGTTGSAPLFGLALGLAIARWPRRSTRNVTAAARTPAA
jgi:hypothetical protein